MKKAALTLLMLAETLGVRSQKLTQLSKRIGWTIHDAIDHILNKHI